MAYACSIQFWHTDFLFEIDDHKRNCNFGPVRLQIWSASDSGPNNHIWTIRKWTEIRFKWNTKFVDQTCMENPKLFYFQNQSRSETHFEFKILKSIFGLARSFRVESFD